MNKLIGINKNNISDLLEHLVDSSVKIIDESDLFEKDELFSALPYGKIINYITKKIIQISDPNEALKKAVALSIVTNFLTGLKKMNITPNIDDVSFKEKLVNIKYDLNNFPVEISDFDINNLDCNELIKYYSDKLNELFDSSISKESLNKINKYRKDFIKIDFLKVIESQNLVFEKVSEVIKSDSHIEFLKITKKIKYEEDLKNLFNDIVLNDQEGMTLADIYIEPKFKVHTYCLKQLPEETDLYYNYRSPFIKIEDVSIHNFLYNAFLDKSLNNRFIKETSNLFFVLGYPGQGKSSLCKKILYDIYSSLPSINKDIFFVKIRNITDTVSLINNPLDTIYEHWQLEYGIDGSIVDKKSFYKSLIILDGLDELFIKENLSHDAIDDLCKILIRETSHRSELKVLVTSRYGYINIDGLKKTHAIIVQLEEFDEDQQVTWLAKYSEFHPNNNLSNAKIHQYNTDPNFLPIKELITQPILLHLIASLNQDITPEMNRATIYDTLFTELINRSWANEGQIDNLIGLEKEDLREFIREIAFAIFRSGREYINKSELISLPETVSFISKLETKNRIRDVLKNIMIAFYFQETKKENEDNSELEKNEYAIEFLHKSLKEYLVAEKICEEFLAFVSVESRRGKFLIETPLEGIEKINKIFVNTLITLEISENIVEIIENLDKGSRTLLAERLASFLPFWFKYGFIDTYQWGDFNYNTREIEIFSHVFGMLINLNPNVNYLINSDHNQYFHNKEITSTFVGQIFTGCINTSLVDNDQIDSTEFGSDLYGTTLYIARKKMTKRDEKKFTMVSMNLETIELIDASFDTKISLINCLLTNSVIMIHSDQIESKFNIEKCILENCNFRGGYFTYINSKFVQCTFDIDTSFYSDECVFEDCVFYVRENYSNEVYDLNNTFLNCKFLTLDRIRHDYLYSHTDLL